MILQFLVLVGMIAFCVWQIIQEGNATGYFSMFYIICPILLVIGIGKRGVITWPIATILLLIQGHWIVGWIPAALVAFTIVGNEWLDKKSPTTCPICNNKFENGEEVVKYRGVTVHDGECFDKLISQTTDESNTELK